MISKQILCDIPHDELKIIILLVQTYVFYVQNSDSDPASSRTRILWESDFGIITPDFSSSLSNMTTSFNVSLNVALGNIDIHQKQ